MQTRVAIAIMVLCISGSGYGQGINPDKAVRDLTSKQAGIQLKAQDDIFTSLGTPKHPSRGQMVSSIIEVATGPEVTEFGPRALAMMGIALERDPSAGDLVDAFERVYRSTPSGGVRDVAVYHLVANVHSPGAMQALRKVAREPVDKADHRAMVRMMSEFGGPELKALAREMYANKWVSDWVAAAGLKRMLGSSKPSGNE